MEWRRLCGRHAVRWSAVHARRIPDMGRWEGRWCLIGVGAWRLVVLVLRCELWSELGGPRKQVFEISFVDIGVIDVLVVWHSLTRCCRGHHR